MRIYFFAFLIILPALNCGTPALDCRPEDGSCNALAFASIFSSELFKSCSSQELVFQQTPSADAGSSWAGMGYSPGFGRFISLAGGASPTTSMVSLDGINWSAAVGVVAEEWRDVTGMNGIIIGTSITNNAITRSTDGVNFSSVGGVPAGLWKSVATGNGLFVAVDQDTGSANSAMVSSDGLSWSPSTTNGGLQWTDVAFGNGIFVAVGTSATAVMTSPDGAVWTSVPGAPTTGVWRAVTFGNGRFVAVADSGTDQVMTSTDGSTWVASPTPAGHPWSSITYGDGRFVALATGGADQVLTSTDGMLWSVQPAPIIVSWSGVSYSPLSRRFAAVASTGEAMYANCF